MIAKSPQGHIIIGTLERLSGCANINMDTLKRAGKGKVKFDYDGYTTVFWDGQRTATARGSDERIFLDEAGNECRESKIVWSKA